MSGRSDDEGSPASVHPRAARRFRLVAFALDDPGDAHSAARGVVEALGLASPPSFAMSPGGHRLYVRVPPLSSSTRSERTILGRLQTSDRVAATGAAVVVDGRLTGRTSEHESIAALDEILDWLLAAGSRVLVGATGIRSAFVLNRLRGLTVGRPDLLRGHIQMLERIDGSGRTDYLSTLAAYFDHGGDVVRAADSMFMHPNTVRYRLRRMKELSGLNLDDPVDRFVAEFQVRMIRPTRSGFSPVPPNGNSLVR